MVVNLETNTVDLCDTIAYLQVQLPDVTKLYHDLSQFSNHTLGDASGGGTCACGCVRVSPVLRRVAWC